jgi:hypothetical protein
MAASNKTKKIIYNSRDRHAPDNTKNFIDNAQKLVTN